MISEPEEITPLQLVDQAQSSSFKSKFEPLAIVWQSLWRLFQKAFEENQWLAALRHSFGGSDGRAQTQGVSESVAVAACYNQLVLRKSAVNLAILTQFKSQKVLMVCKFGAVATTFFCNVKGKFSIEMTKSYYRAKQRLLNGLIFHWSLRKNKASKNRVSAQFQLDDTTTSDLVAHCAKAWKRTLAWISINYTQTWSLQQEHSQLKMLSENHLETCIGYANLDFWYLGDLPLKFFISCAIDQPSTTSA